MNQRETVGSHASCLPPCLQASLLVSLEPETLSCPEELNNKRLVAQLRPGHAPHHATQTTEKSLEICPNQTTRENTQVEHRSGDHWWSKGHKRSVRQTHAAWCTCTCHSPNPNTITSVLLVSQSSADICMVCSADTTVPLQVLMPQRHKSSLRNQAPSVH